MNDLREGEEALAPSACGIDMRASYSAAEYVYLLSGTKNIGKSANFFISWSQKHPNVLDTSVVETELVQPDILWADSGMILTSRLDSMYSRRNSLTIA
jgi:hypothetical protein